MPQPRIAKAKVAPDDIPTLVHAVKAPRIPTLEAPIDGVREPRAARGPRRAGAATVPMQQMSDLPDLSSLADRRESQSIIAGVVFGLLGLMTLAAVIEIASSDRPQLPGNDRADTPTSTVTSETPNLVLLTESIRPPIPPESSVRLAQTTAELLRTHELLDPVTVEFALHSLKAALLTHAEDSPPMQSLEDLTRRLADEARIQRDQGNTALAIRLIQQASQSGVALEYVQDAADYVATPSFTGAGI